nr:MAG TPA: PROTEIN/DNA Complex catalytic motif, Helix-turn-helix DNA [Caudoviricetes sp.]
MKDLIYPELYDIPGYSNYQIDKVGNVYNKSVGKYLKPTNKSETLVQYSLCIKGKGYHLRNRNQLLALTFCKKPDPSCKYVLYHNRVAGDDSIDNIYWSKHPGPKKAVHIKYKDVRPFEPIVIKNIITDEIDRYESYLVASECIGINKSELLRRLNCSFGIIFKDKTMIKYESDKRSFPNYHPDYIAAAYSNKITSTTIKGYNHFTGTLWKWNSLHRLFNTCSLAYWTLRTYLGTGKIHPNGWELKRYNDKTPWKQPTEAELIRLYLQGLRNSKPCLLYKDGKRYIAKSIGQLSKALNLSSTTVSAKIRRNPKHPFGKNNSFFLIEDMTDQELQQHLTFNELKEIM